MAKADVLIGLQWGDEGKGQITEYLSSKYNVVARFMSEPNCARILPHGINMVDKTIILGNGAVISPDELMKEVKLLEDAGIYLKDRLFISKKSHLLMPSHRMLDKAYDSLRGGNKIGSSRQGVGPTCADKANRIGLRVGDINDHFAERFATHKAQHETILRAMHYFSPLENKEIEDKWLEGIDFMKQFQFVDTERKMNQLLKDGNKILCEGSRGTMLDVDFGSYPFVASSNMVSASACIGLGLPPTSVGEIYGVAKAYSTRVGAGPLPTEIFDSSAKKIREKGEEIGTGTESERRCGWIDLVALKYAVMINGVTKLIITKNHALDEFETIKACVAYKKDVEFIDYYPDGISRDEVEPVYVEMQGWKQQLQNARSAEELPPAFLEYIAFIAKEVGIPVTCVSVGPDLCHVIEMSK